MHAGGTRGASLVFGGAAVLVVLAIGTWIRAGRAHDPATAGPPLATATPSAIATAGSSPAGSASASTSAPQTVVVDVAGKVRHPGVYRLPAGARVEDALRAAGGARPNVDLNRLNLAAVVVDGEQIPVGIRAAVGAPAGGGGGDPSAASGPVDLNTATLEQLETLPGVGPVLGQRILDWRDQHSGFTSIDQLDDVPGIGTTRLSELTPLVTV